MTLESKQTRISRLFLTTRLTILLSTRARIDVLGRHKKFPKEATYILGDIFDDSLSSNNDHNMRIIHISFFWQISDSSPINGAQMFVYSWYPRKYKLKDHFSESESTVIEKFSLLIISCKTFSSCIFCLTNLELLLPDCSSYKILQWNRIFECYHSMSDSKV